LGFSGLRGFGSRFNFLQRWIRTGSENPTVSYCKTLGTIKKDEMTEQAYIKHIENSIEEIKSIDFKNSWAYEQVIHSILKIQKLPIILFNYPKNSMIFRSRINEGLNVYEKISDISAPDSKFVNNYARANKPKQTLFYGSENRPTSYLEFVEQLAEVTPIGNEVLITIGGWELQKDLTFVLVYNPSDKRNNEYNQYHRKAFDNFIEQTPIELRKGTVKFFEFIGKEFSKPVKTNLDTYLITCAYSNIIFSYEQCDGIMYPSVPSGGIGFNVAIKENIIKNDFIQLKVAKTDKFIAASQENGKHNFLNNASIDITPQIRNYASTLFFEFDL